MILLGYKNKCQIGINLIIVEDVLKMSSKKDY